MASTVGFSSVIFIAFCISAVKTGGPTWGYYDTGVGIEDVSTWAAGFPNCNQTRQSPINIDTGTVTPDPALPAFNLTGYNEIPTNGSRSIANNGYTVKVTLSDQVYAQGGGLDGAYQLLQFHIHWGSGNNNGSEHTVDGTSYPAEIHFVHRSMNYTNTNNALLDDEGLAVLGVLVEIGGSDNTAFNHVLNTLSSIPFKGDTTSLPSFALHDLLPSDQTLYYRYMGSLTTPGCDEAVVWTVFTQTITISQSQMNTLRTSLYENVLGAAANQTLADNFRPTQTLGARTVTKSGLATPVVSTTPVGGAATHVAASWTLSIILATAICMMSVLRL